MFPRQMFLEHRRGEYPGRKLKGAIRENRAFFLWEECGGSLLLRAV